MSMRPKKSSKDLPPKMLRRTKKLASGKLWIGYYYNGYENGRRKEIPLGTNLAEAKRKWADMEGRAAAALAETMDHIFDRYEREIVPGKAITTQKQNIIYIRQLRQFFGTAPINEIEPRHIAQYRDIRKTSGVNNEIALFSHAYDMAREWGYTDRENPARGIRKRKLKPRDYYVERPVWDAVYSCACEELRDAMDLAYLTGQRPSDVLKMTFRDIKNGALEVRQGKTGKKLRIAIDGTELGAVIERIRSREAKIKNLYLVQTGKGRRFSMTMLHDRFKAARSAAAKAYSDMAEVIAKFQFRDIRAMAATDISDLSDASKLLGHSKQEMTKQVYRRKPELVNPTR